MSIQFNDAKTKVIAKAWKDETFREKLKNDPSAAFKECGFTLNSDVNLVVQETKPKEIHLNLLSSPVIINQLSESEIDASCKVVGQCGSMNPTTPA